MLLFAVRAGFFHGWGHTKINIVIKEATQPHIPWLQWTTETFFWYWIYIRCKRDPTNITNSLADSHVSRFFLFFVQWFCFSGEKRLSHTQQKHSFINFNIKNLHQWFTGTGVNKSESICSVTYGQTKPNSVLSFDLGEKKLNQCVNAFLQENNYFPHALHFGSKLLRKNVCSIHSLFIN